MADQLVVRALTFSAVHDEGGDKEVLIPVPHGIRAQDALTLLRSDAAHVNDCMLLGYPIHFASCSNFIARDVKRHEAFVEDKALHKAAGCIRHDMRKHVPNSQAAKTATILFLEHLLPHLGANPPIPPKDDKTTGASFEIDPWLASIELHNESPQNLSGDAWANWRPTLAASNCMHSCDDIVVKEFDLVPHPDALAQCERECSVSADVAAGTMSVDVACGSDSSTSGRPADMMDWHVEVLTNSRMDMRWVALTKRYLTQCRHLAVMTLRDASAHCERDCSISAHAGDGTTSGFVATGSVPSSSCRPVDLVSLHVEMSTNSRMAVRWVGFATRYLAVCRRLIVIVGKITDLHTRVKCTTEPFGATSNRCAPTLYSSVTAS